MKAQHLATEIVRRLTNAGYTSYFAGGWVRDYLMGHATSDIDIATAAPPEKVMQLFSHTVPVGVAFGVVIVVEGGHPFEVTSFRRDGLYIDGRRPAEVAYSTPEEDAQRRDFTINGMFFDPLTDTILDYVNGRADLKAKIIRAIGNPLHRFQEDRLRMVRAVRFAARFGFPMDPATEQAIIKEAPSLLPAVAMERIWQEFKKMSDYPHLDRAFLMLHRLGLLSVIFPQLKELSTEELQNRLRTFLLIPKEMPLVVFLMELFPDLPPADQLAIGERLKVTNADLTLIQRMAKGRDLFSREMKGISLPEPIEWAHFEVLPDAGKMLLAIAARSSELDRKSFIEKQEKRRKALEPHLQRMIEKKPLVTSQMLMAQGVAPGKKMGALLKEAERLAVNHDCHDSEEVLRRLQALPLWSNG